MVPSLRRRRALRTVGGLALASVAGCLGREHVDPGARTTEAGETTAPEATTESTDVSTETRSETTTRQYLTSFPPDERLLLRASDSVTVTVEMYESESKETRLAAETYALGGGEKKHVTEFEPDGYVTVDVGGEPTARGTATPTATAADPGWESYVGSADRIVLAVSSDGVEEVSRSEA